jgi:hypothetical protein
MIMSNIANILTYLRSSDAKFIRIVNQETNKTVGKTDIYLTDIPNEDLEHYIKFNLGTIPAPTLVWIEMRQKKGTTSIKENGCKILVDFQDPQRQDYQTQPKFTSMNNQNTSLNYNDQFARPSLGAPEAYGLGMVEVVKMQVNASRYEDKVSELDETKTTLKRYVEKVEKIEDEYKKKINSIEEEFRLKNSRNHDELNLLKAQLATAESQKNLAVMLAQNETKSWIDSPAFEKLMEQAPAMLSGFAAMKGGGMPITGALGAPNLPAEHREFIEFVSENLNENQVNFLGSICHYINNEPFVNELKMLLTRYSTHA